MCYAARMSRSRQYLCAAYAAIAALALVGTWTQNLFYFHAGDGPAGFALATGRFWAATLTTPASISIVVDLALFFVAASVFMVLEARRLEIRGVWLYVIFGFLVAISVTFPLFLIARERRLAAHAEGGVKLGLSPGDVAALVGFGSVTAAATLWTLGQWSLAPGWPDRANPEARRPFGAQPHALRRRGDILDDRGRSFASGRDHHGRARPRVRRRRRDRSRGPGAEDARALALTPQAGPILQPRRDPCAHLLARQDHRDVAIERAIELGMGPEVWPRLPHVAGGFEEPAIEVRR
jgi:uncharacterized protein DUF2834